MQSYRLLKNYETRDLYVLAGTTVYETHDPFGLAEFEKLVKNVEHKCVTRGQGHREFVVPLDHLEPISVTDANGTPHEPEAPPKPVISPDTRAILDEPSFTILGSDNASGQLMAIYALACEARGDGPDAVARAKRLSEEMDTFCRRIGKIPGRFSMKAPVLTRRGLSIEQAAELKGLIERVQNLAYMQRGEAITQSRDRGKVDEILNLVKLLGAAVDRFAFVPSPEVPR